MPICKTCNKARQPRERIEHKDGKAWLIESCKQCGFNFELTEWAGPTEPIKPLVEPIVEAPKLIEPPKKPKSKYRFGSYFRDETDYP